MTTCEGAGHRREKLTDIILIFEEARMDMRAEDEN